MHMVWTPAKRVCLTIHMLYNKWYVLIYETAFCLIHTARDGMSELRFAMHKHNI